jgi:probable F420-dependent oxidoreductase
VKIRVGVGLATSATSGIDAATFAGIVDALEGQGWDSVWFSERVASDAPDPLVAMAAVAGRTAKLKFGPSVMVVPGRHPVLLAKELATLDVISGGRLIAAFGLGVDAGADRKALGVPRAEAAARTDEAVELIRLLWSGERVTFEGRFFTVTDIAVGPRPVQRPHPDVWFGGTSAPALRRAGRLGDGWLPSFVTSSEYKALADVIRQVADEEGRKIDEEHFGALIPYLPTGTAPAEPILEAIAARRPGVDPKEMIVTGDLDALTARLEAFTSQGASKFVVTPIVRPADWSDELNRLREDVARPLEN